MSRSPDPRTRLRSIRDGIDRVDRRILDLLHERAELACRVGEVKRELGGAFYAPGREEELVRRLQDSSDGPFPAGGIRAVWKEIISASLSLEAPLTVAYLGPPATFTHRACQKQFGLSARYQPARTITDVFDLVEKQKASYGVIPVENTTEGVVSHTLDMFLRSDLKIVAEEYLRVTHNLMNRTGRKDDVVRIYSHPHAVAQCRGWLETNLPAVPVLDAPSTAQAARMAAEDDQVAAIAGELAAELYGLETIEARVEDNPNNFTRFLVVGREIPDPSGSDKTTVLFAVKDAVGALYHMLRPFYDKGVNLTKIESRPMRDEAWQYVFFIDCEGHLTDPKVAEVLTDLEKQCRFLRVLGSYPCSEPAQ